MYEYTILGKGVLGSSRLIEGFQKKFYVDCNYRKSFFKIKFPTKLQEKH